MEKQFKFKSGNTMRKLVTTALIIGGTAIIPGSGVNMSRELPKTYDIKEMIIYQLPEKKLTKPLTAKEIKHYLDMALKEVNLPVYLNRNYVKAKIFVESHRNPEAVSEKGARGLMQIMKPTWSEHDSTDYEKNVFNPEKNILVGVKHLKQIDEYLRENFPEYSSLPNREKQDIISATYNTGTGNLKENNWNLEQLSKETRNHVEKMRRILGN